jgi:hypothetical protein
VNRLTTNLIEDEVLHCAVCKQSLRQQSDTVVCCSHCGIQWPIRNSVIDLFNRYQQDAPSGGPWLTPGLSHLCETIIAALELPQDQAIAARVHEIVRRAGAWRCDDSALTAEIKDLADRFAPAAPVAIAAEPAKNANREPKGVFERHYVPTGMAVASQHAANVRVKNVGDYPWSSRTAQPLLLHAQWVNEENVVVVPSITSVRFPIDIEVGRSMSVPLNFQAPAVKGRYQLRCWIGDRNRAAIGGALLEVAVMVDDVSVVDASDNVQPEIGPGISDYGQDHAEGVRIIEAELKALGKAARILEVGSGTHPQLAWLTDHELVALDVSSPLLELGALYFRDRFTQRLGFVCADAVDPPFAPASFDVVALFSALHHFPEPESLLARLAKLLRPQGFLAVMCEPVSDTLEHADTIRDLLKGINEQVFSLDEYLLIFRAAGLRCRCVRVDGGSLKAILTA